MFTTFVGIDIFLSLGVYGPMFMYTHIDAPTYAITDSSSIMCSWFVMG
jgi:hypothetical protein